MDPKEFQLAVIESFCAYLDRLILARDEARTTRDALRGMPNADKLLAGLDWPSDVWELVRGPAAIPIRTDKDGRVLPYFSRQDGAGRHVPAICFKVPTGGGKTYLAAECAARLINSFEGRNTGLVLWIVPTDSIYAQTLGHLRNREHPYRQILDRAAAGTGNVRIIEKDAPLHAKDLEANLCVMVLMLQSARRADKQTLRFFRDRGDVHGFLPPADDLPAHEAFLIEHPNLDRIDTLFENGIGYQGRVARNSLGNALRLCRPIVVMDEGHYAYTPLAMETIYGLNPSFVLELSATPSSEANLLVNVSGAALEREEMIKLPINVTIDEASPDWRDTLRKAWDRTQALQAEAERLQGDSGRYVRPILLVQVERTGKDQVESGFIHAKAVREFLQGLGIGEDEIAEKTADTDELKKFPTGVLLKPECPIRVIITKQALQEGWDCPFAYVLCSLSASKNQRSLTQLIGRILRQPNAKKTGIASLDECYVYCHHATTGEVVNAIRKGLEEDGMGDLVDRVVLAGGLAAGKKRETLDRRPKYAGLRVFFPKVLWVDGDEARDLDYERDILSALEWGEVELNDITVDASTIRKTKFVRLDLGVVHGAAPESQEVSDTLRFDPAYATRAILDVVPNPWVAREIVGDFVDGLISQHGWDLDRLASCASDVISSLRSGLVRKQDELAEAVFRRELVAGRIQFRLRTDAKVWKLPDTLAALMPEDPRQLVRYDGSAIQNSVFPVYEHDLNNLEQGVARYLDDAAAVSWWHRNVARGQGYGLQGWRKHRVYPDVLIGVEHGGKPITFLAVETKGDQLSGNLDTRYKQALLDVLSEAYDFENVHGSGELEVELSPETVVRCGLVFGDSWQTPLSKLMGEDAVARVAPTEWISASALRNWCEGEPVLDWLDLYGEAHGYMKDNDRDDFSPMTDMGRFVREKGNDFERQVVDLIGNRLEIERGSLPEDDGDWALGFERTLELMRAGVDAVYQGVVACENRKLWGRPDLLVRSDRLQRFIDEPCEVEAAGSPTLGHEGFHYVPIDIKFKSFNLLKSGEVGADDLSKKVQVAVYALALEGMQGHRPVRGFMLGRCVNRHKEKGENLSCFGRLAPVTVDLVLGELEQADTWARKVRAEGASWSLLDSNMLEMQLNMSNQQDFPWHATKRELSSVYRPLTALWQVTPRVIGPLLDRDVRSWSWDMPIEDLGLSSNRASILREVLLAQKPGFRCTDASRVFLGRELWGEPADVEFYVDFETVTDLDDDFSALPLKGGSPRIFMVGCGHVEDGRWVFRDFTAADLSAVEEERVLREWVTHMESVRLRLGPSVERPLVFHWSHAEVSFMSSAYNSAVERLGGVWPEIRWYDLLSEVVRPTPFVVNGALGFGLKAVAKSLHALGLIETKWEDGPIDGLAAMVGAWRCDAEARASGVSMAELPLMREIRDYNEVDCRVMWEIVKFLRQS